MAADPSGASVRAITCPGCGGSVEMRASGYTVTLVCEYCGSVLDVTHSDVRLIKKVEEAQRQCEIPLGTRGLLRGVEWQAVGYVQRSSGGASWWEEYLLFNPYHGYRWLIAQDGRWSFGTMLTATPAKDGERISWDGRKYRAFFERATTTVEYVLGEFYWRVKMGDSVITMDYARPGAMLSMEENVRERSWTFNELLRPGEIRKAFPGVRATDWYWGGTPAPHQPSPFAATLQAMPGIAMAALGILLVVFIILSWTRDLGGYSVPVTMESGTVSRSFGPIALHNPWQAVTIETRTPNIEQGWTDIDISLVDRRTQASFDAYSLNEHYSGRDSDGSWSEGSRYQKLKIAGVPSGSYDLVVDISGHVWSGGQNYNDTTGRYEMSVDPQLLVKLEVKEGAAFFSNLMLAFFLILLPLGVIWFLHFRFEKARLYEMDRDADMEDWAMGLRAP